MLRPAIMVERMRFFMNSFPSGFNGVLDMDDVRHISACPRFETQREMP
jgi:hypothetical protein